MQVTNKSQSKLSQWVRCGHALLVILVLVLSVACSEERKSLKVLDMIPSDAELFVDQTISLVFSEELAEESVHANSIIVHDGDNAAFGKLVVDGSTISYIPALLSANTDYTITVTGEVMSVAGTSLKAEFQAEFTTLDTLRDGTPAPSGIENDVLPKRFVRLSRKAEIFAIGDDVVGNSNKNMFIFDPMFENLRKNTEQEVYPFDVLASRLEANEWDKDYQRLAVHANLDHDPREDIAVLTYDSIGSGWLQVVRVEEDGEYLAAAKDDLSWDLRVADDDPEDASYEYDLTAGDLDNDGFDELVVISVINTADRSATVTIFDDAVHKYGVMAKLSIDGNAGIATAKAAIGDFDNDREIELALVYRNRESAANFMDTYTLKDDAFMQEAAALPFEANEHLNTLGQLEIKAGNVDGNPGDELVLGTTSLLGCPSLAVAHLDEEGSLETIAANSHCDFMLIPSNSHQRSLLAIAQFDLDAEAEIYWNGYIGEISEEAELTMVALPALDFAIYNQALVADLDGDGRDDISMIGQAVGSESSNLIKIWSYQEKKNTDDDGEDLPSEFDWHLTYSRLPDADATTWSPNTLFVDADVDFDSTILVQKLDDEGELIINESVSQSFTDNTVIAVIAGPPCFEEFGQDLGGCSTAMGLTTSGTFTVGGSLSVSASVSVGTEVEAQAGGGLFAVASVTVMKASAKITAGIEASVYGSFSITQEQTITNLAAAGEDLVIFHTTPFNRYTYEIVSVDENRAEELEDHLGTDVIVDVPLKPRVLAVSRDYYNRANGNEWDVDEAVFPNDPSDFASYPRFSELDDYLLTHVPLGLPSTPVYVNEGAGGNEVEVGIYTEGNMGSEVTLTQEVEGELCTTGVCVGGSAGSSQSMFVETTIGAGTTMAGSVSAMPEDHFAEHQFQYGLFSYLELPPKGGLPFVVVNYYVID